MKKGLIIVLLIGLIFISGIKGCEKKPTAKEGYLGGVEGLDISFAENEPPEKVLDSDAEPFFITLLLKNKGEYDIPENGIVITLTGINKDAFQINDITKRNDDSISGTSIEQGKTVTGGQDEISYEASYKYELPSPIFEPVIGANICYRYGTGALANVCLRKDAVARASETDVCIINEEKSLSTSGAPIQVITLSERSVGTNEVRVVMEIGDKGEGVPYLKDTFNNGACLESGKRDQEDKINVKVSSNDDVTISCNKMDGKAEGVLRLIEGVVILTCDIDTSRLQETTFISPLKINLDYMYKDFISKKIKVESATV